MIFKSFFRKNRKPAFITFGGQEILDLFDDEEVAAVIRKEPELAEIKKRELLWAYDANEKIVNEIMAFTYALQPSGIKGYPTFRGTLKSKNISIRLIPEGYELIIDKVLIRDDVSEKSKLIDLIHGIKSVVTGATESVSSIKLAVKNAKNQKYELEAKAHEKVSQEELINSFFRNHF